MGRVRWPTTVVDWVVALSNLVDFHSALKWQSYLLCVWSPVGVRWMNGIILNTQSYVLIYSSQRGRATLVVVNQPPFPPALIDELFILEDPLKIPSAGTTGRHWSRRTERFQNLKSYKRYLALTTESLQRMKQIAHLESIYFHAEGQIKIIRKYPYLHIITPLQFADTFSIIMRQVKSVDSLPLFETIRTHSYSGTGCGMTTDQPKVTFSRLHSRTHLLFNISRSLGYCPIDVSFRKRILTNKMCPQHPPLWGSTFNPFTPKSDQFQISPAAPPVILYHTVWRTWLFLTQSYVKMIIVTILPTSPIHFSLKCWENVLFELGSERVNVEQVEW